MKICSFVSVVVIVLTGVCTFAKAEEPNAAKILRHYKESLSYLESVSMKIEIEIDVDTNHPNKWFCPYQRHFIFRQDHDRAEWLGKKIIFDSQEKVDPLNSRVIKQIMTGELYLDVISTPLNTSPRGVVIRSDYKERQKELLEDPEHGGALFGKMYGGSYKSIAELLAEPAGLYLRPELENISGVPCYVLEAMTEYGKITAWITPDKGYNALKWSIHKSKHDFFDETPVYKLEIDSWIAVFDSVKVQRLDNLYVTTGGNLTLTIDYAKGHKSVSFYKYKVGEVQLNPDFEAMGAFKIYLPNGTRLFVEEHRGVRYIWQNGEIVPADAPTFEEIDKMVEELKKEKR